MSASSMPVRVLIADDHAYTRAGVRLALEQDGFEVCAEASTGKRAVAEARRTRPDIALLDVYMPDGSGTWAASEIARALPGVAIVMLSFSRDDEDLLGAVRAGASGYLLKDMEPSRLGGALRSVLAGEAVLPRSAIGALADHLPAGIERAVPPSRARLTAREEEVAELLRAGEPTEAIAKSLSMSTVTVRVHIRNILTKLGVTSREEASRLLNSQNADR